MANNVLEFYIKLKDMMSSGLARVAKMARSSGSQIVSAFKGVDGSLDSAAKKATKVGENIRKAGKEAKEASFSFKSLAKEIGIGLSVASLVAFTKSSLAQSALAENQKIAFKVLLGDKRSGDDLYNQIYTMANQTPYESQNFMQSAKMLLGFGERRSNIMPDLKSLGDIAAAQDDPTQAIWGLSHAYGEVIAAGRLLGRNTLEMINWGFNPLKEISLMTGKSMGELKQEEERGAISAEMVRKAFEHATSAGGKYNDMMKQQAQTLSGKWSTFMDLVHLKMRDFGDLLAPVAKSLMAFATDVIKAGDPTEWMKFSSETDRLRGLRIELGLSNTTNARRLEIFKDLKENYPDIVKNIKDEQTAIKNLLPDLDSYLNKRYLASGVLKIKEQYADDLEAVSKASSQIPETYGQATALAAMFAGRYGINATGLSAGQLQSKVLSRLKVLAPPNYTSLSVGGAAVRVQQTQAEKDRDALQMLFDQNKAAQELYRTHIAGANKAQAAVDQFNKIMGISTPAAAGGKGGNPYGDTDTSTAGSNITGGIARGGPRVININGGVKFTDRFDMHVTNFKGGVDQVQEAFENMLLRTLQSGASVQQ